MNINIDLGRVTLTTGACFVVSALSFYLSGKLNNSFIIPLSFALTVPLAHIDKLVIKKTKALLLSVVLTIALFFFATLATFGLLMAIGKPSLYVTCAFAGVVVFLINSIYTRYLSFKTGLICTGVLALTVPIITQMLNQHIYDVNTLIENTGVFFICLQTLVGLGISLGVWLKTEK